MSTDQRIDVTIAANADALVQLKAVITGFAENVTKGFKEIGESMQMSGKRAEELTGSMQRTAMIIGSIQPILNAFGKLKSALTDCVGSSSAWNTQVNQLARTMGTTTVEAGGLAHALKGLNVDADTYKSAAFMLQRQLDNQEEAFNRNGIATRNSSGELLGMQDIMMNTINRIREMKPGYDANALSMMAFGRGAKELQGIMKLTNEKISEGTTAVEQLGITVDGEGSEAVRNYRKAVNDVRDSIHALKIKIGTELMPTVSEAMQTFAKLASEWAGPVAKAIGNMTSLLSNTAVQIGMVATAALVATPKIIAMFNAAAIAKFGSAIVGLLNPWSLLVAGIAAGVYGLNRWITASSRAAEQNLKLAQSLEANVDKFRSLSDELLDVDKEIKGLTKQYGDLTGRTIHTNSCYQCDLPSKESIEIYGTQSSIF